MGSLLYRCLWLPGEVVGTEPQVGFKRGIICHIINQHSFDWMEEIDGGTRMDAGSRNRRRRDGGRALADPASQSDSAGAVVGVSGDRGPASAGAPRAGDDSRQHQEVHAKEVDDLYNAPDWFPDQHPPAPEIVLKGRVGAMVMACGSCHLMSGLGHPESADLTGYTADYFVQQMMDFRAGAREDWARRMDGFAKAMTDEEIRQAAAYFSSLPRRRFVRVEEAAMVPKTFVGQGRMRFIDPKQTGTEPIGDRIIMLPVDQELARKRDPRAVSGFIAYVPPGSLAAGKALAEGGGGKTLACATCHGDGLKGMGTARALRGCTRSTSSGS